MANSLNKITTKSILDATVATADIAADAVTGAKIADDAIDSEHYTDGSIDTAHIADDAVTSAKIADDAITSALIADDAITSALIADDAIVAAGIADNAVVTAAINADAVTSAKIADDAIGPEHIETLNGDVKFGDSGKLFLGAGDDLEIKHAGDHNYIWGNGANSALTLGTVATSALTIDTSQDILVQAGDIVFKTAGKGICLGVTSNTDANTLDDYEEGTWTPDPQFNQAKVGMTVNVNGNYTKIGNQVIASFSIRFAAKGSSTGNFGIYGVPFSTQAASYYHDVGSAIGFQMPSTEYGIYPFGNNNKISFRSGDNNTGNNDWGEDKFDDDSVVMGTVIYRIA